MAKIEKIAQAGWERVQKMETYAEKMRRMIELCGIALPDDV